MKEITLTSMALHLTELTTKPPASASPRCLHFTTHCISKVKDKFKDRIEYTLGKENMYEKTIVITTLILSKKP